MQNAKYWLNGDPLWRHLRHGPMYSKGLLRHRQNTYTTKRQLCHCPMLARDHLRHRPRKEILPKHEVRVQGPPGVICVINQCSAGVICAIAQCKEVPYSPRCHQTHSPRTTNRHLFHSSMCCLGVICVIARGAPNIICVGARCPLLDVICVITQCTHGLSIAKLLLKLCPTPLPPELNPLRSPQVRLQCLLLSEGVPQHSS